LGEKFPEMNLKLKSIKKLSSVLDDPLLDPNFDRQLLGACSLEVTGPEFHSLVSQVKDLFAELPIPYIEVYFHFLLKIITHSHLTILSRKRVQWINRICLCSSFPS
jgi:hypothetical protein